MVECSLNTETAHLWTPRPREGGREGRRRPVERRKAAGPERERPWYRSPLNVGLVLAVAVLASLFFLESDDCYFVYWQYDSWKDLLLTRPDTSKALIVGVPQNGRYLGNLLGVLLAKCSETPLFFLRPAYFAGGFLLLAWGGACSVCPKRRKEGLFLLLALLILSYRGIWQEVYSWGAAYVNYLTPVALMLLLPPLLRGDGGWRPGKRRALLAVLSLAACLFMETVTIFLFLSALIAAAAAWASGQRRGEAGALLLGSALGTAVMFLAPGYSAVNSDGLRELGLSLVGESLAQTLVGVVVRPALAALLITGLLLRHLKGRGGRAWVFCGAAALPLHGICLWTWVLDLADPGETVELPPANPLLAVIGAVLAVLWLVMLLLWRGHAKWRTAALAGALCLISAPLLVIGVSGSRYFFPSYVVLALAALSLYDGLREEGLRPMSWIRVLALGAACTLIVVYYCNNAAFRQRLEYGREQAAAGAEQVTLPLVPFPGFARNEQQWKGDLSYLIYREVPWDVALTFVPCDQWDGWDDLEER